MGDGEGLFQVGDGEDFRNMFLWVEGDSPRGSEPSEGVIPARPL